MSSLSGTWMKHPLHCGLITLGPFHPFVFLNSANGTIADDHKAGNSAGVFWHCSQETGGCLCLQEGVVTAVIPTPVGGLWHHVVMSAVPLVVFGVKTR